MEDVLGDILADIFDVIEPPKKKEKNYKSLLNSSFSESNPIKKPAYMKVIRSRTHRWSNRFEYIFCLLGSFLSFRATLNLPSKVLRNGGIPFLILVTLLKLTFGFTAILIKTLIGQYQRKCLFSFYKFLPVLCGIPLISLFLSFLNLLQQGLVTAWKFFFIILTLFSGSSWHNCWHNFNTKNCVNLEENSFKMIQDGHILSSDEFWNFYVTKYRTINNTAVSLLQFNMPNILIIFSLLIVWLIPLIVMVSGSKIIFKTIQYSLLFCFLDLLILTIVSFSLPGSSKYLFELKYLLKPLTYYEAIEHVTLSFTIGTGFLITFSSLNEFYDNFIRDSFIICALDSIAGIFITLIILNAFNEKTSYFEDITSSISIYNNNKFISTISIFSLKSGTLIWTLLYFLLNFMLGLTSQITSLMFIVLNYLDKFKKVGFEANVFKIFFVGIIFIVEIFIASSTGFYVVECLQQTCFQIILPIILIIESLGLSFNYDINEIQYEYFEISGFFINSNVLFCIFITNISMVVYILFYKCIYQFEISILNETLTKNSNSISIIIIIGIASVYLVSLFLTFKEMKNNYPDSSLKGRCKKMFMLNQSWRHR